MKRLFMLALLGTVGFVPTAQAAIEISDKFSISGEVRARDEYYRDYDYDSDGGLDDHLATLRTTIGFHLKPVDNVTAVVELRDWRRFGEEGLRSDPDASADDTSLYQGYLQAVLGGHWLFKIGRQEVRLGTGRMFGNYDYYKGLSHDAAIIGYTAETWNLYGFAAKWHDASNSAGGTLGGGGVDQNDDTGYGLHFDKKFTENRKLSAQLAGGKLNSAAGDPTLVHLSGSFDDEELANVFYGVEGIIQIGTVDGGTEDKDIFSGAFHAHVGGKFAENKHRVWLEIDLAGGNDDDAEKIEEFTQLFQETSLSSMDLFPLQNIVHGGLRYQGKFVDSKLTFDLGLHYFQMYSEYGDIYGIDVLTGHQGKIATGNGDDTDLGFEVDLGVGYKINDYLDMGANLGFFSPGDALAKDGDSAIMGALFGRVKI